MVWVSCAWCVAWQLQVGRMVARHAPRRELSACLALVIAQWVLEYAGTVGWLLAADKFNFCWQAMLRWEYLLSFAGAIVVRRGVRTSGSEVSAA